MKVECARRIKVDTPFIVFWLFNHLRGLDCVCSIHRLSTLIELECLKAFAHPIRKKILPFLSFKQMSNKPSPAPSPKFSFYIVVFSSPNEKSSNLIVFRVIQLEPKCVQSSPRMIFDPKWGNELTFLIALFIFIFLMKEICFSKWKDKKNYLKKII